MKRILLLLILGFGAAALLALFAEGQQPGSQPAQQPANQSAAPPSSDPSAPILSLDEKISLTTDDLKQQDALQKANEEFQKAVKPVVDHQEATKKVIEQAHPGWQLVRGPQGWQLTKKPEEKKPAADKPAAPADQKKK